MIGVYNWAYAGGSFVVEFRTSGVFYSSKCTTIGTTWATNESGRIIVDWKEYGKYEFSKTDDTNYDGYIVGKKSNWRKLKLLHEFNEKELSLQGNRSLY